MAEIKTGKPSGLLLNTKDLKGIGNRSQAAVDPNDGGSDGGGDGTDSGDGNDGTDRAD